jgi:hypothetical protein
MDDGDFQHGWKVTDFQIRTINPQVPTEWCNAILGLNDRLTIPWDFGDFDQSPQIGWATCSNGTGTLVGGMMVTSLVDDNEFITDDLFLYGDVTGDDPFFNYLIRIESVNWTKNQALYQAARNAAQGAFE